MTTAAEAMVRRGERLGDESGVAALRETRKSTTSSKSAAS